MKSPETRFCMPSNPFTTTKAAKQTRMSSRGPSDNGSFIARSKRSLTPACRNCVKVQSDFGTERIAANAEESTCCAWPVAVWYNGYDSDPVSSGNVHRRRFRRCWPARPAIISKSFR